MLFLRRASVGHVLCYHWGYPTENSPQMIRILLRTSYDVVASGSLQRFFIRRSYFIHFFSWNSNTIDGFMLFNDLYISGINFGRFFHECYGCYYAVVVIETMSHNHCRESLVHVHVHDLFSCLHFYCRKATPKGNNWNLTKSSNFKLIVLVLWKCTYLVLQRRWSFCWLFDIELLRAYQMLACYQFQLWKTSHAFLLISWRHWY